MKELITRVQSSSIAHPDLSQFEGKRVKVFVFDEAERSVKSNNLYRLWLRIITQTLIVDGYTRTDLNPLAEDGLLDEEFVSSYLKNSAKVESTSLKLPAYRMNQFLEFVRRIAAEDFSIELPEADGSKPVSLNFGL